ncbi:efflux RND transporter periplasmic adaptor subunit [Desulfoluna spongiiphila]|uniref:efflux RND transporter periplasmic adaptor subunit n=1 Tax=Desulfoluna spongiiphila TaxID=419481 RepID=UPI0012590F5D|nr:efflux RND transporter periplasmic adaptor subunit [Desulfoluna spongiiphila]VVS93229.1 rnd efflux pump membrane fusion protein [Desulfoluna spongiiphila]
MGGRVWGGVILGASLLALGVVGCSGDRAGEEVHLRPVRVQKVVRVAPEVSRVFSGYALASVESRLSFKVPGTLKEIPVKVGDFLDEGALVAALDDRDYRLRVQEAEAGLDQARAQARNASLSYERARRLWENDNISKSDLDRARAAWESSTAQVTSIEKKRDLANRQLGYTRLVSPVAGSVTMVLADENENTGAGVPVAILASGRRVEVHVDIPEVMISGIRGGQRVAVRFAAMGERPFPAVVYEVGTAATGFAATYPVTLRLVDEVRQVLPGMAAEVTFRFPGRRGERFLVPSHVVGQDASGPFLYAAEHDGEGTATIRRLPVAVGALTGRGLEIFSGLTGDEWVVTAGMSRLSEGMRVLLKVQEAP